MIRPTLLVLALWALPGQAQQPAKDLSDPALVGPAPAKAPPPSPLPMAEERPESFGKLLLQLVVVLGLVVGLIYLTLNFGLRRVMGLAAPGTTRSGIVSVVERMPLEPRVSLYVVKAGADYLLLGRTDHGLNTLHKLSSEEVERLQREKPQANLTPFLQKLLTRRGEPPPSA